MGEIGIYRDDKGIQFGSARHSKSQKLTGDDGKAGSIVGTIACPQSPYVFPECLGGSQESTGANCHHISEKVADHIAVISRPGESPGNIFFRFPLAFQNPRARPSIFRVYRSKAIPPRTVPQ
jgi:hypothetical protein